MAREVHLIGCVADDGEWAAVAERGSGVLSAEERAGALACGTERARLQSIAARVVLRLVLADYLGVPPEGVRFRYGQAGKPLPIVSSTPRSMFGRGRPVVSDFNLSHCGALMLLAITRSGLVGVDVERVRQLRDREALRDRAFTRRERLAINTDEALLSCWVRKEALIKMVGGSALLHMEGFTMPTTAAPLRRLCLLPSLFSGDAFECPTLFTLREWLLEGGYRAALCATGLPRPIQRLRLQVDWLHSRI